MNAGLASCRIYELGRVIGRDKRDWVWIKGCAVVRGLARPQPCLWRSPRRQLRGRLTERKINLTLVGGDVIACDDLPCRLSKVYAIALRRAMQVEASDPEASASSEAETTDQNTEAPGLET